MPRKKGYRKKKEPASLRGKAKRILAASHPTTILVGEEYIRNWNKYSFLGKRKSRRVADRILVDSYWDILKRKGLV